MLRKRSLVAYRLAQRSTLPDCDLIPFLHTESWRYVRCQILVSLFVSRIFRDEVKVFTSDDEGSVHFGRDDGSCKNTATDRDLTGERTFLIYGLLCQV